MKLLVWAYFIGICVCRVIDYEKEYRKICKTAGIQYGNCTPGEKLLVNEYLKLKQETVNLEEELVEEQRRVKKERMQSDIVIRNMGRLEEQKDRAYEVTLKFVPRDLVDKVENRKKPKYVEAMPSLRERKTFLEDRITKWYPAQLKHVQNKMKNKNLNDTEREVLELEQKNLTLEIKAAERWMREEIVNLTRFLPPTYHGNTKTNGVETRKHIWLWILYNTGQDLDVARIWKQLRKLYQRKSTTYKNEVSFEKYVELFCEGMDAAHEQDSVTVAHILLKYDLDEGFDFDCVPVFDEEALDDPIIILVNAVGFSPVL